MQIKAAESFLKLISKTRFAGLVLAVCAGGLLAGCQPFDPQAELLTRNTQIELVDWHVSGLWVINCPVAWIRVNNYNSVPIHDITFEYETFDQNGKHLDKGTFTIEGTVPAGTTKNFIELYLGLVDLYSERLTVKLLSVKEAH